MKNSVIIIILSLFVFVACNDGFLEKFPLDEVSDESFWRSASDIEMYANQFYTSLDPSNLQFKADNKSDNQGAGDRNTYIWNLYTLPTSGGGWAKSDWLPIRRCNYALARIADMEKNNLVLMYEGEIRFFRAYFYQKKIQQFGDVPWFDKDLNIDSEELYKARDSRKVVFANMLEDLDFAIANLPETSSAGRLTKYAVLCFKSEACLYEGTFRKYHGIGDSDPILRECVEAAESVINSGKFSVYSTGKPLNDYFDLFVKYELAGNKEAIMYQNMIEGLRTHDDVRQLGEQKTGYTKDFINSYLCTDGLPIALSLLYQGDEEFVDEFENRDPRMRQSVYTPDRPYRIYASGIEDYKTMPEFDKNYCMTSYFITKGYSPYESDRLQGHCTIDRIIFRYGRLLVGYAEAKAELGECTQTVLDNSINKLRARVGMPHLTTDVGFVDPNWPNWEVPVSSLINEIRRERRIETCAEGTRWDDLVRWKAGKRLEDPLTYRGAFDPATGDYRDLYPGFTRVWDNKLYLYPIPTQERALNPNLEQNPGWE
ncbi:MAG: RagB/SusD family nutrient uptake outer membrane protein [Mangrovibacterium sp.]|nr:RagB/SusD family nutrient uptake outer membrane protein [Mangrovibacterium sp.]